jgi:hypothetical protein
MPESWLLHREIEKQAQRTTQGGLERLRDASTMPKSLSVGIAAPKGRLSPAAQKFWQCVKEAASAKWSRLPNEVF